jgi:hypothetical protein
MPVLEKEPQDKRNTENLPAGRQAQRTQRATEEEGN